MSVVGPLFAGLTVIQLGGHIRDYVSKAWAGKTREGGKSLAKGLAAGAIELISWLTFKVGGGLLKGAKAAPGLASRTFRGGASFAKRALQGLIKGSRYLIKQGKVLFKGIANSGIGKQFKRLQDLGKALLARTRFRAFRIRFQNRRFKLEGLINPWVLLSNGEFQYLNNDQLIRGSNVAGNYRLGEKIRTVDSGLDGIVIGGKQSVGGGSTALTRNVDNFESVLPELRKIASSNNIPAAQIVDLYEYIGPKGINRLMRGAENSDEVMAAFKAVHLDKLDGGHSVFSHGPQVSFSELGERLKRGWIPEGWRQPRRWSPSSASSRFKDFKTWVKTREKAFEAVQRKFGFNLDEVSPQSIYPSGQSLGVPTKITVTVEYSKSIGKGYSGMTNPPPAPPGRARSHITRSPDQVRIDPPNTIQPPPAGAPAPNPHPNKHRRLLEESYKGNLIREASTGTERRFWLYTDINFNKELRFVKTTIEWDGAKWKVVQHFPTSGGTTIDWSFTI